ncbi:MAG: gfo/Idh/MocA family oxidoreductase [Chloroflexi bacterium]|nr:MAG: gfo/Idh/MocA family oxidoreductase [Chloroflexota bacterium]RLC85705.1 MAG: gfo/Idh/MocA family oxidoreductase [Chloroflexota bacterium]HEY67315.1 Gfo/Idh/MocA family oxidoreductase [Thermoflexia bacterium]
MDTPKVAVIGVGAMGRNHARVYHEMPDVELAAVADLDPVLAKEAARLYGARIYTDYRAMLEEIQPAMVSVVVPTQAHCQVTLDALEAGCHVLVEKPIAATLEEGRRMIERAAGLGRVLAVGHIERYNPAVIELKHRLDNGTLGRIFQIHARRLGPFPARVRDVGVVVDLATHDLDIMRYLTGSEVRRLYAEVEQEIHTAHEDLFSGLVRFKDGVVGVLNINWLTPTKMREITVTGQRGMFLANLLTQDLYFYENEEAGSLDWNHLSLLRGVSEGQMVRLRLQRREPLRAELEAFVAAARGEPGEIVRGEDGLRVLELARALIEASRTQRVITLS